MSNQPSYAQRMLQAQADEITKRVAPQLSRFLAFTDGQSMVTAARVAVAEALVCLLEDAAFYGEDVVSTYRLRRLKEQLNPADTSGADT